MVLLITASPIWAQSADAPQAPPASGDGASDRDGNDQPPDDSSDADEPGRPDAAPPDSADSADTANISAAQHYREAEAAMARGHFAAAAAAYERAFAASGDSALLFKIAEAHRGASRCERAREFYDRYLATDAPDDGMRAIAAQNRDRCGQDGIPTPNATADSAAGAINAARAHAPDPVDATASGGSGTVNEPVGERASGQAGDGSTQAPSGGNAPAGGGVPDSALRPPPELLRASQDTPTWRESAGWISVGAATAFITAGAVLALAAESREEDIDFIVDFRDLDSEQPSQFTGEVSARYRELVREGERLERYSRISFAAAGLGAVAATVFFVLDARDSTTEVAQSPAPAPRSIARPTIAITPGGATVLTRWEF